MTAQISSDRRKISAEWTRVGGGFSVEPALHGVDIEDLLVLSACQAPADHRLFFTAATWLGVHHQLVDMRRLGRLLRDLDDMASAVAGAMFSVGNSIAKSKRVEAVVRHCRPLAVPRVLFERTALNPALSAYVRENTLPVFAQWGLLHDEISLKLGAVRPIQWILFHCPELRTRALLGAGLDSQIVERLQETPHTVADLARSTRATYAATHESCSRLIARGLIKTRAAGKRPGLVLVEPVAAWFDAFPEVARPARRPGRVA